MDTATKAADQVEFEHSRGMSPAEIAYMRGPSAPAAGSVPHSTSKYLNSVLFKEAFATMSLRRFGKDVANTYDIPDMSRGIRDVTDYGEAARLVAEERGRNPAFARWLDERRGLGVDLPRMEKCAPGTLGRVLYDFIVSFGMEMFFINNYEAKNDHDYLMRQIGHTHDIQHLVTGFGPNIAGEIALSTLNLRSFPRFMSAELAHYINVANSFVTSASFSRTLFNYPGGVELLFDALKLGIAAGEKIKQPLFMIDYSAYFDWRLEDITADLGFDRGPGDAWFISEETMAG